MSNDGAETAAQPPGLRVVGWLLVVGGVLYATFGTIGLFSEVRSEALIATAILVFGVGCLLAGRGLLRDSRRAHRAAVVLLAVAAAAVVVRAFVEGDRVLLSQLLLPGLGLWLLLRQETRSHFAT